LVPTTGSPPIPRLAPDPEAGRLTDAEAGELIDGLVGEGPGAGHHPNGSGLGDLRGEDSDAALLGSDHPRTVRPDQPHRTIGQRHFRPQHVEGGNALGDADRQVETRVGRLEDGVGRARGRHEDDRRVRARLRHRLSHRLVDGDALDHLSTLARVNSPDHLCPVLDGELRVELAHSAEALYEQLGIPIAENGHS
jgi:hypothetical protein